MIRAVALSISPASSEPMTASKMASEMPHNPSMPNRLRVNCHMEGQCGFDGAAG